MKENTCIDCRKKISKNARRCLSCKAKYQIKYTTTFGHSGFKKGNTFGKRFVKGQKPTKGSYKKGHKFKLETILKFRRNRLGIHNSPITEFKSLGIIKEYRKYKHLQTPEYNRWRKLVFKRDAYTCKKCYARGGYLEAHHKHFWIDYPKERFWVKNGITLCGKCHKMEHKQLRKDKYE